MIYNFFGCDILQQTFIVQTDGCFCDLAFHSPARRSSQLMPIPSRNVENYRLERFTSSGQSVWSGDATDLDQAQLPQAAGTSSLRQLSLVKVCCITGPHALT
ncbi:MAG: hypothetical protein HRU12_21725, partial [Phaeodactylibacter sp.]|nr:hypothetical protein [Phaeodactylibacter sp.]